MIPCAQRYCPTKTAPAVSLHRGCVLGCVLGGGLDGDLDGDRGGVWARARGETKRVSAKRKTLAVTLRTVTIAKSVTLAQRQYGWLRNGLGLQAFREGVHRAKTWA